MSDGRRITADAAREWASNDTSGVQLPKEEIVRLHPDFRIIALANRPGYPFLGNDLFAECGDVFACHAIENPDSASEYALLRSYGPHVTQDVLFRLIALFNELRSMVDQGLLLYPFSTRELVNIVKHLEAYAHRLSC